MKIFLALSFFIAGASAAPGKPLEDLSLRELDSKLASIDSSLEQLARFSLRSGVGGIGYRSLAQDKPDEKESVEIGWDTPQTIDEIVLVPTLWRDAGGGFQSDGFPEGFRVIAGTTGETEGKVIATYDESEHLSPRIAPLVIPVDLSSVSWLRIETTRLSRRAFDKNYIFQLAELMVFNKSKNIALHRPVVASSVHPRDLTYAWGIRFLVDGHTPYLMDAAWGEPSLAYMGSVFKHSALTVDLGEKYPLSEIRLHPVDQSATVPQAYPGNLGIPPHLLIEGANQADFQDAVPLLDLHIDGYTQTGPVMMWSLPDLEFRYVRITCPEKRTQSRFGFAEIEIFSGEENVTLNKPFEPNIARIRPLRTARMIESLTDGRNLYGNILPLRLWMNQLAKRHQLETQRPLVVAELNRRYANQKQNLQIMSWIVTLLAATIGFTVLIERMLRMRQATRIREQFAADLHDELGANIHTIGLLGDLAREAESQEELLELLDRSRQLTERSGVAISNCSNMLETKELCEDLVEEMKRYSGNLLADLDHKLTVKGADFLKTIGQRKRVGLFFFYKECLTNIIRHSGATRVSTKLVACQRKMILTVTDNGHGLSTTPPSLKRRSRLLGGKISTETLSEGGTKITLRAKINRRTLL